jgi:hypothetical protein
MWLCRVQSTRGTTKSITVLLTGERLKSESTLRLLFIHVEVIHVSMYSTQRDGNLNTWVDTPYACLP